MTAGEYVLQDVGPGIDVATQTMVGGTGYGTSYARSFWQG